MEKVWFRYFGLCAASSLIVLTMFLSRAVVAEQTEIRAAVVDVEVPIEGDDMAAAKQTAQKLAFEKALDQTLPQTMDAVERADKIKHARMSINGFHVIKESLNGNRLAQTFKIEVKVPVVEVKETLAPLTNQRATFEVAWLPDEVQFNAADLLKFTSDVMSTPATSVRIQRGNIVLTIPLRKSLEETQTQLATFVGRRGLVKLIRRDENRPPDSIASPVITDSPQPPLGSSPSSEPPYITPPPQAPVAPQQSMPPTQNAPPQIAPPPKIEEAPQKLPDPAPVTP